MTNIYDHYKHVIIQIATPYGSGTGFYNKEHNLFITNFHVIEGCDEVLISGRDFKKTTSRVLYFDPLFDLAFLEVPHAITIESAALATAPVTEGDSVIAIGHPYGLKYTATKGIVSKAQRFYNEIAYIQIDAAINAGNSGGPLVNEKGEIAGVNTFIIAEGESLGFSLPSQYVIESLEEYALLGLQKAIRCRSCKKILSEALIDGNYCSNCGAAINNEHINPKPYIPAGAAQKIEQMIERMGRNVKETRTGYNLWEIEEGSATIKLIYNSESRFIVADAWLCNLPKENIMPLYEFMLRENYDNEGLVFSVNNQTVLLSFVSYEDDLSIESGVELLQNLIKKADEYDDILIERFAAQKRVNEDD
ncbi:MAG TPA: trypsin-like peptidase domain-containing protein [Bacteroidales bacterium]|nr:trypsin-like peptidase domain-containing protein [Bacteroidales bacterium]